MWLVIILPTSIATGCSGKDHDRNQDPSNIDSHENHVTESTAKRGYPYRHG